MTVYPVTRKMKEIITITCIVFLQQHTCVDYCHILSDSIEIYKLEVLSWKKFFAQPQYQDKIIRKK
jgi:hypothetical protein